VDLRGEKVVYSHIEQSTQLEIGLLKLDWTDLQLSRWLDKECRQPDLTQPVLLEFCRRTVAHLTEVVWLFWTAPIVNL
jgi:type III restriction enzyme